MTEEEIINWNESYKAMSDGDELSFYGYDEEEESCNITGVNLKKLIEGMIPKLSITLYNDDGEEITKKFWEGLTDQCNIEAIKEKNEIRYGYTTERGNIRMLPYEGLITADKDSNYFCELQVSSILMNEPVMILHESADGQWYYIFSSFCSGWIKSEKVGICSEFAQWKSAMNPSDFIVVTGDKIMLEEDTENENTSAITLYMGKKLELVPYENYVVNEKKRVPFECYIVKIPIKNINGSIGYEYGFVPVSRDVKVGYLAFTSSNIIKQMFKVNGNRYGWGGMYKARDCSQYIMELYRTFGFLFGRNSSKQAKMPFATYDVENATDEEKKEILSQTPVGSILYFPGHVMMYLGEVDDEYYVISATGRMMSAESENENAIYAHTTLVTPLSVRRISGKTWLSALTSIKIIGI